MKTSIVLALPGILCCGSGVALSGEKQTHGENPSFVFTGGVGVIDIKANEYVYDGDAKISQLIWDSTSPVLSAGALARFEGGWTLALNGAVALGGHSKMMDYDWFTPFATGEGFDDWSHLSTPADTRLDHYFSGSIALGHDFALGERTTFNLNGGFKYTDVKWSGYGGTYIHSVNGPRDTVGTVPDGFRVIDYRQQYPVAFVGLDVAFVRDRWTFGLSAQGGMTFSAGGTDNHYRYNVRYEDHFNAAPVLALGARVDYAMTDKLSVFVSGTYDRMFHARADTTEYDNVSGGVTGSYADDAGGDFRSGTLTIGLKSAF